MIEALDSIKFNINFIDKYSNSQNKSYSSLKKEVWKLKRSYDGTPSIRPIYGRIIANYGYRKHPILGRLEFHPGLDIPAGTGTPVRSTAYGRVKAASWAGGYGLTIVIKHRNKFSTIYAHLSKMLVEPGDVVTKGQVIGLAGSTGLSTGPHLHYEIRYKNKHINPNPYLNLRIFRFNNIYAKTLANR